jgi:hypothetical protein
VIIIVVIALCTSTSSELGASQLVVDFLPLAAGLRVVL